MIVFFWLYVFLPCSIRRWFTAQCACLPNTIDHVVADGTEDQRELSWQIIKVQRANTRQVGPQVSVDPWTLDAYESAQVQTGPGWILEKKRTHTQIRLPLHLKLNHVYIWLKRFLAFYSVVWHLIMPVWQSHATNVSEVVWNPVWTSFKAGLLNLWPVCQTMCSSETLAL